MQTLEYQCSQFKHDVIENQKLVEFLQQRRYMVILLGPIE